MISSITTFIENTKIVKLNKKNFWGALHAVNSSSIIKMVGRIDKHPFNLVY